MSWPEPPPIEPSRRPNVRRVSPATTVWTAIGWLLVALVALAVIGIAIVWFVVAYTTGSF